MAQLMAQIASLQTELDAAVVAKSNSEKELAAVTEQLNLQQELNIIPEQLNSSQDRNTLSVSANLEPEQVASPERLNPQSEFDGVTEPGNPVPSPVDANGKIKRIVEALLFATEHPMTVKQLQAVFPELEEPEKQEVQKAIDALSYDYREQAVGLHQVASGYRFQVKTDMATWVARLFAEKPPKYSRALLETLAIIAYQQPVTRGDIEEIRGVSVSSNMIRTLLEREWVKVLAHKEVPGRPALYGTTKEFLDYFNLPSLDAMPPLEELQALALEGEMDI